MDKTNFKSTLKNTYNKIEEVIEKIKEEPKQEYINDLTNYINLFFSEAKCEGISYTNNIDKLFFGAYIMPEINSEDIIRAITTDKKLLITNYYIELDSKLFDVSRNLNAKEITALLIHDVNSLVSDSMPSRKVIKAIDDYLVSNNEALKLSNIVHYREILSFGFRDAIRKVVSIFESCKHNIKEDTLVDFIDWTDYTGSIQSALQKLSLSGDLFINKQVTDKFIVLSWVLRVYNNVTGYRIPVNKSLEKFIELTPSKIERKELENFIKRINKIDDDMLLESSDIELLDDLRFEKYNNRHNSTMTLNEAKEDVLTIMLRNENIDYNEPDGTDDLIHNINNNITMIKDYAENFVTNKKEFSQWNKMFKSLQLDRNRLAKNQMYKKSKSMINKYKYADDQ